MSETILVVDDEDGVRRTFAEWLATLPNVRVHAVADAEAALNVANTESIDLAVLDWNLGSGLDGLSLLEDLAVFQPDIVAILVTGFANQATPLEALRMGVRDYLDKNQNLTRETFLAAVRKQLDRIIPAKRHRELNLRLNEFRGSVEKILPLVRNSAALQDPVPLPTAIVSLFRFLLSTTHAGSGALVVRHAPANGPEQLRAYAHTGAELPTETLPYRTSLAAMVQGMQEVCVLTDFSPDSLAGVQLQPFERHRTAILAAPVDVGPGVQVVLELFDKPAFFAEDKQLIAATSDVASELLRQSLAQKRTHELLFAAVEAALRASQDVTATLHASSGAAMPPTAAVMESLKLNLALSSESTDQANANLQLMEAVRELSVRHGPAAVEHCVTLVQSLRTLLDNTVG